MNDRDSQGPRADASHGNGASGAEELGATAGAEAPTADAAASGGDEARGADAAAPARSRSRRLVWLGLIVAVFALAGLGYAAYWAKVLRYEQSTDDAYVSGNVVQVTPQLAGTVVSIGADDTQYVKAGQTLVQLDPADARIALEQAEAKLAGTVREVRGLYATTAQLEAALAVRNAEVARATEDLARRERLASAGAVSGEELTHARNALTSAKAAQTAAEQALLAQRARIDRTTVANHPDVLAASALVHDAYLALARTALPAPVSGFVAKRAVQLGQRVAPGAPLMAIVPLDQVWVDANFKEPQLADMRLGQPVTLTADLYGRRITYHGTVAGFGAGTGGAFALLPAQNATGNWIKVVQRVPVRIALDAQELAAHPLQVGLSMDVEVDTHQRSGARLPQLAQATAPVHTDVYANVDDAAQARIKAIIAANDARGAPTGAARNAPASTMTARLDRGHAADRPL